MSIRSRAVVARLSRLAAVAVIGLATTTVFAHSAAAARAVTSVTIQPGTFECSPAIFGSTTVRWTLKNNTLQEIHFSTVAPATGGITPTTGTIANSSTAPVVQTVPFTGKVGDQRSVTLTINVDGVSDPITSAPVTFTCPDAASVHIQPTVGCKPGTGVPFVSWVVDKADVAGGEPASVINVLPAGTSANPTSLHIGAVADGNPTIEQLLPRVRDVSASITLRVGTAQGDPEFVATVEHVGVGCTDGETPPPTATPTPTVSPGATASLPGSPSSGAAAPGGLPVTGTSVVTFAGVAIVLVGGGIGMLVLARRRRASENG